MSIDDVAVYLDCLLDSSDIWFEFNNRSDLRQRWAYYVHTATEINPFKFFYKNEDGSQGREGGSFTLTAAQAASLEVEVIDGLHIIKLVMRIDRTVDIPITVEQVKAKFAANIEPGGARDNKE